ncbi:DNA polymerase III subunit alpha [Candidatus Poribacteria bacterium]|nr:MAG: DNA polymerase III subunit alpha [Candidatus Poribacteria bacterium]
MNKLKMTYFDKEDILHLVISEDPQGGSLELTPNITAELNDNGNLIGVEILNASSFIKDIVLEGKLAKELTLADS